MVSRFDYPDPGTDPAYCDGLSDEPNESDTPCPICGAWLPNAVHYPYCSVECGVLAEIEDENGD